MKKIILAILITLLLVSSATAESVPRLYVIFDDGKTVEGLSIEHGFLETEEGQYFSTFYQGKIESAYIEIDGEIIFWTGGKENADMTGFYAEWIWLYNGELVCTRVIKDWEVVEEVEEIPNTGEGK